MLTEMMLTPGAIPSAPAAIPVRWEPLLKESFFSALTGLDEFPPLKVRLDDERVDMVENPPRRARRDVADRVAEAFHAGFEAVLLEAGPFMAAEALFADFAVGVIA